MRRSKTAWGRVCALISGLALAPMLGGCGSPAVETPKEIPPAPQDAAKTSAGAFFNKAAPKPAAPK